jgi:hypothetical protein
MKMLLTIRTANRAPKANYLGQTVRSLIAGGVCPDDICIVPTDDHIDWLLEEIKGISGLNVAFVNRRRTANENGIAQVALLQRYPSDWIVMTEDDLEWCADPVGSMSRWLDKHATPERTMYRFFSFPPVLHVSQHASEAPLKEQRGSQVVALRSDDAIRFAMWARTHPVDWRPKGAPFQNRPDDGFDKLLGYWALQDNPTVTTGLVSRPFFVRHLGVESSLHGWGRRMDAHFAGQQWSYRPEMTA